jgi:hypothetical protein
LQGLSSASSLDSADCARYVYLGDAGSPVIALEGKIMEHDNPEFEEAFGIYVGPVTHDEVVAALRNVPATSESATGTAGLSTSTRGTRTTGQGICLSSTSTSRRSGTA